MVPFAVRHDDMAEGQGVWVLEVDTSGDRLLLARDDGSLYWRPISDCKLIKVDLPDQPRPVMLVQPKLDGPQVLIPGAMPNRAMRRNGSN